MGIATQLDYSYRDAGGWQTNDQLVVAGPPDPALLDRIAASLGVGLEHGFVPEDVDVAPLQGQLDGELSDDDHAIHQLWVGTAVQVDADPAPDRTLEQLADTFERAAAAGWPGQYDDALLGW